MSERSSEERALGGSRCILRHTIVVYINRNCKVNKEEKRKSKKETMGSILDTLHPYH